MMSEAMASTRDWLALKAAKEAFVSNLEGTSKREIFSIVMVLPICALFGERAVGIARPRASTATPLRPLTPSCFPQPPPQPSLTQPPT
jgi:hypothetical protein